MTNFLFKGKIKQDFKNLEKKPTQNRSKTEYKTIKFLNIFFI